MIFKTNDRILFIGDSITDCGRFGDPEKIGDGYVRVIRDYFLTTYMNKKFHVINKGISGNRVTDLADRWESDVIQLSPDWVSISIGINDVWRQLDSPEMDQVDPELFKATYTQLLAQLKAKTNARIILMEPTVIEENVHSEGNVKLIPYIEIVHKLANQFDGILVRTHQSFVEYLQSNHQEPLTSDGVHMNSTGNILMAQAWLKEIL